ncbi:MAG: hypothetical protein JW994_03790, partial [Candidatus Omnitrophica bacterium]|nr:hypothetical protein [Candidatus Omnitrophota bacterium]
MDSVTNAYRGKVALSVILIAITLVLCRLAVLWPVFDEKYVGTYQVAGNPTNDAGDWIEGSQYILEGRKTQRRPLFSAFMAIFVFFFGVNTRWLAAAIIGLNVLAILSVFYILKDIKNSVFVVILISFFAAWRLFFLGFMLTENMASPLLMVGFALVIKALFTASLGPIFLGYFIIGLAEATRPWDFMILATLPLFFFFYYRKLNKKTVTLALGLVLSIFLGFSLSTMASRAFSSSQGSTLDLAQRFYGQVHGGGSKFWITQSDLKRACLTLPAKKAARVFFEKSFADAASDPGMVFVSIARAGWLYLKLLHLAFSANFYPLCFFVTLPFVGFAAVWPVLSGIPKLRYFRDNLKTVLVAPLFRKKLLYSVAAILLYAYRPTFLWMTFSAIGFFILFLHSYRRYKIFVFLYLCGIVSSLMMLGVGSYERLWMSSELLLYCLAALGITSVFIKRPKTSERRGAEEFKLTTRAIRHLFLAWFTAILILIALPMCLAALKKRSGKDIAAPVSPVYIASRFGIREKIIPPKLINTYAVMWPEIDFDKIDGSIAYF